MKNIIFNLLCTSILFASTVLNGQVKIKWEDVKVINDQTIVAKVFAQNYGRGFEFYNGYGYYGNKKEANFFVEYDLLRENRRIKVLPSSVTIKTIFGTSIEMDTPTYFFNSTGTENGQHWEIIFKLPYESANITLTVLGSNKDINDFEQGKELKQKLKIDFLENKDTKVFDYSLTNSREYIKLEEQIKKIVFRFGKNNKKGIINGTIVYSIKKDGATTFDSNINNPELSQLIHNSLGNYDLNHAVQYGYPVNSEAKYDIFIAKGRVKVRLNQDKQIVESKPNINNGELLEAIQDDIKNEGKYKVKFNIMKVNKNWYPYSFVDSKEVKFNYMYVYWGVPIIIGVIAGASGGGS